MKRWQWAAAALAGTAAVAVPLGLTSGGGIDVLVGSTPTPASTPTTITCNQTAANSSELATAITAASNGQTVCLTESVDYGTWNGTSKAITIIPQSGTGARSPEQASIFLELGSGDANFTIDGNRTSWDDPASTSSWTGLWIRGANFNGTTNGPHDITIRDSLFQGRASDGVCATSGGSTQDGGCIEVPLDAAMTPRNVLIEHNVFRAINDYDVGGTEAAIRWPDEGDSGWTVKDNLLVDVAADGLKVGGNVTITNNLLLRVEPDPDLPDDVHADAIQLFSGLESTVRGNWVHDCEQGISGFDGMGDIILEHNLVTNCTAHHISFYGDNPASDIRFNTINAEAADGVATHGRIECGARTADPTSIPNIYNNVARFISYSGADKICVPTRNDHNLCDSACGNGTSQATGTPVFVGGSDPDTWDSIDDACLASGSPGLTAATDSGQVGLCGGDYNSATDGPPEGEGYP